MYDLAEVLGDPTDLLVVEAVWACHQEDREPSIPAVTAALRRLHMQGGQDLTIQQAHRLIRRAVFAGEISQEEGLLSITEEDAARTERRYWYWMLQVRGVVILPLYHWPNENLIARQAVTDWIGANHCPPNWDELNTMMTAEVGDWDISNQMAHNAFLCGAIQDAGDPEVRFVLGDYTPFNWDALL